MQPHIMREPPPCLTVGSTSLLERPSPAFFQAHFLASEPRRLILVSSEKMTHFQSKVQWRYLVAESKQAFLCLVERKGCFCLTTGFRPEFLRCHLIVVLLSAWAAEAAVVFRPLVTWCTAQRMVVGESDWGWLPWDLGRPGACSDQIAEMEPRLTPVLK
jgi:hypothetical protein